MRIWPASIAGVRAVAGDGLSLRARRSNQRAGAGCLRPASRNGLFLETKHNSWLFSVRPFCFISAHATAPLLSELRAGAAWWRRLPLAWVSMLLLGRCLLRALALAVARHSSAPPRVRAFPHRARVLQHGVPRPDVLEAADAARLRLADDFGDGAASHAAARRRRRLVAAPAAPSDALFLGGFDAHELRAVAVDEHADFRRHEALDDRVSVLCLFPAGFEQVVTALRDFKRVSPIRCSSRPCVLAGPVCDDPARHPFG